MKKTKYRVVTTNKFKKDYKKMKSRNNFDEEAFITVVTLLANGENLPSKYCNHLLEPKSQRNMGMPYKTRLAFGIYEKQWCISFNINQNRDSFRFVWVKK